MVCEPFVDGAVRVRSPIHTYAHLVRKLFTSGLRAIQRARVYEALAVHELHGRRNYIVFKF